MALHLPPAAVHGKINQRKSRDYPSIRRRKAQCVLSGSVTHFFFSLALTISIVIAASTHTHSIHNPAGCNKFPPVLLGLSSGILGNIGDNYLKSKVDMVGCEKVASEKKFDF